VPRYHQIAQALRERIATSAQAPGERLDNQRNLAREFGVTLMTLRQALDLLERDGLIARRHGLGTFVARPAIDYDILHLRALAGDLSALGEDVATRFLRSRFEPADRRVAEALGVSLGERVARVERLRFADDAPIAHEIAHLPGPLPRLRAELERHGSLYRTLREVYEIGIAAAEDSVETALASPLQAQLLRCDTGLPMLLVCRTAWDAEGRAVEFTRSVFRGDRFRFVARRRGD
jgi:GntR family transcriptional regulator